MGVSIFRINLNNWSEMPNLAVHTHTVDSRYLDFGYLEEPLISKRKSGPCLNITSGNKILSIRGEIAPREQFLPFSTIFSIYISK